MEIYLRFFIWRNYRCLCSWADSLNSKSRCLCWSKKYMQLQVRAMETYPMQKHMVEKTTSFFLLVLFFFFFHSENNVNELKINSHGIICEEIQGSRKSKCDKWLVQKFGAMLQIPYIGKRVLSEMVREAKKGINTTMWFVNGSKSKTKQ